MLQTVQCLQTLEYMGVRFFSLILKHLVMIVLHLDNTDSSHLVGGNRNEVRALDADDTSC